MASLIDMLGGIVKKLFNALGYRLSPLSGGDAASSPLGLRDCHVENCRVLANREALLKYLPRGGKVAEVGVALGDFSDAILRTVNPAQFYAIDLFGLHKCPFVWGRKSQEVFEGQTHEEWYRDRFRPQIDQGCFSVLKGVSWEVLAGFPDLFFDVMYLDAAHDYESVKKDAAVATRKIKREGALIFNDYIRYDHVEHTFYGVVHVVNELCVSEGYEIAYLALQPDMYCDVLLRQRV